MRWHLFLGITLVTFWGSAARPADDEGFVSLFNGKDLTGWVNVNCAPETFFVKDNMIITTGQPTGFLRTERQYENFIIDFDWMHMNKTEVGNSGLFVWGDPLPAVGTPYTRGIEVQVLVNLEYRDKKSGKVTASSHGDVFAIHGATCIPDRPHPLGAPRCLPSENRCKGGGEWNHYRVETNNGVIKLAVNGKVVSGVSKCKPRKGYLALESEGAECRFKNIKIKELPSSKPGPDEVADVAQNHRPLYTGLDLRGWKKNPKNDGHWQPKGFTLNYDGKGADLWTDKDYGDFEMICDWKWTGKPKADGGIYVRGSDMGRLSIQCSPNGSGTVLADPKLAVKATEKADKAVGQWNRFKITMKGDRLTVNLNGKNVIDNATVPSVSRRGAIGLQQAGTPMQFANLFVRELK